MRRRAIVLSFALLVGPCWQLAHDDPPSSSCEEDMACWDCNTMGNGLCGPDDPTPFEKDNTV
jgi:hypothetical protein